MVDFRFKASKSGYATALSTAVLMTLVLVAGWVAANKATADELQIGESKDFIPLMNGKPYLHVIHEGRSVKVQRVQDPNYELKVTSRRRRGSARRFAFSRSHRRPGSRQLAKWSCSISWKPGCATAVDC